MPSRYVAIRWNLHNIIIDYYLIYELSVDAPDGVTSVPVELLGAGRLVLRQALPQALQVLHALQVALQIALWHALQVTALQAVDGCGVCLIQRAPADA